MLVIIVYDVGEVRKKDWSESNCQQGLNDQCEPGIDYKPKHANAPFLTVVVVRLSANNVFESSVFLWSEMWNWMYLWVFEISNWMLSERITYCIDSAPLIQIPCENRLINTVIATNDEKKPETAYKHEDYTLPSLRLGIQP